MEYMPKLGDSSKPRPGEVSESVEEQPVDDHAPEQGEEVYSKVGKRSIGSFAKGASCSASEDVDQTGDEQSVAEDDGASLEMPLTTNEDSPVSGNPDDKGDKILV